MRLLGSSLISSARLRSDRQVHLGVAGALTESPQRFQALPIEGAEGIGELRERNITKCRHQISNPRLGSRCNKVGLALGWPVAVAAARSTAPNALAAPEQALLDQSAHHGHDGGVGRATPGGGERL